MFALDNSTYHAGFEIISQRSVSDEYYAVSVLCVIIVKIQMPILNFDEVSQLLYEVYCQL